MALGRPSSDPKTRGRHVDKNALRVRRDRPTVTDISPSFKLIFAAVFTITVVCLLINLFIVLVAPDSAGAQSLADTCSTAFKLGFGAMVGLVGGKVT